MKWRVKSSIFEEVIVRDYSFLLPSLQFNCEGKMNCLDCGKNRQKVQIKIIVSYDHIQRAFIFLMRSNAMLQNGPIFLNNTGAKKKMKIKLQINQTLTYK